MTVHGRLVHQVALLQGLSRRLMLDGLDFGGPVGWANTKNALPFENDNFLFLNLSFHCNICFLNFGAVCLTAIKLKKKS